MSGFSSDKNKGEEKKGPGKLFGGAKAAATEKASATASTAKTAATTAAKTTATAAASAGKAAATATGKAASAAAAKPAAAATAARTAAAATASGAKTAVTTAAKTTATAAASAGKTAAAAVATDGKAAAAPAGPTAGKAPEGQMRAGRPPMGARPAGAAGGPAAGGSAADGPAAGGPVAGGPAAGARPPRPPRPGAESPFTDVPKDSPYAMPITWAVDTGVAKGTSDTTFSPDAPCTRAQAITFLWRAKGSGTVMKSTSPFSDLDTSSPYYPAAVWAYEANVTQPGADGAFSPDAPCTTAQVLTFLWRAAGEPEASKNSGVAAGLDADAWYTNAVAWADASHLLDGLSFSPDATCTRGEVIAYLFRAFAK